MQSRKKYFAILLAFHTGCFTIFAQDVSHFGNLGLIYTPSAYLTNWGDLYIGITHYPAKTSYTFEQGESAERSFLAHLGFLPFGEFTLKLTKPYNSSDKNYGIGDRSVSFRLQVLKETKNRPALLVGTQDPFAVSSFFNTNYAVLSKKYQLKNLEFNANVGYGFKIEEAQGHILQGIFGGIQAK
ncbi:MAG: YjbH domain-containing protein [Bacteroidota bacterium]